MAKQKKKSRWIGRILGLILLAGALAIAWFFLSPTLMTAKTTTQYLPYTVETRDISTSLSFSGTVEILHSQQITAGEGAVVREVFVEDNQPVQKDDKLLQLEDGTVFTANMDGVVNQVRAREGGYAMPGMALVQVCDLTNLQITMSVDEYDISTLSVGQPCRLYFLALEETFDAEISRIDRVSTAAGSTAYYTVSVELTAPENVLPGMQVCVTIPREQLQAVDALPIEAITFEGGQPVVYVENGDAMTAQPVTLGLNDETHVQLLSGASLGDTVYAIKTTTEEPQEVTLSTLYQKLFGKTVVINEPRQSGRGQRGDRPAGNFPEGMEMPEGMTPPEGMEFPEGMEMPEGMTPPDGMERPEGMTPPDGMERPEGMTPPQGMDKGE